MYIFYSLIVENNLIEAENYQKKVENLILRDTFSDMTNINTLIILKKDACSMVISFLNRTGLIRIFTDSSSGIFGYSH